MKQLGVLLAFFLTVVSAYPQGDVIFDNFGGGLVYDWALPMQELCPTPASAGIVVQLYAAMTANSSFTAVPGSIVPVGIPADGYFDGGVVRIPASIIGGGAAAFMEVRAWELAYGATYEEARAHSSMGGRPARTGISNRFMVDSTGNPNGSPPGTPVPLSELIPGFTSGFAQTPCPEPTILALGFLALGGFAILYRRRKKST